MKQARELVQWEMTGAEVDLELSGELHLPWRASLGKRLNRRLDASQTPDVREC
jgi:hypothetical protein